MPEQQLDRAQIGARFEQVRRETVPHGVRPDALGETGPQRRFMARVPHDFVGDRLLLFGRLLAGREQVPRGLIFAARQYSRNASYTFWVNGSFRSRAPLPCWTWINMSERSMSLTFRWAASDRRNPVA